MSTLATIRVSIDTAPGDALTEKGLERFTDAVTTMVDDGVLAEKIKDALIEAGAPHAIATCLSITYEEVR